RSKSYSLASLSVKQRLNRSSLQRSALNSKALRGWESNAVRLATRNAAQAGRVPGRDQGLAMGQRADFVLFDFDKTQKKLELKAMYLSGQKVWGQTVSTSKRLA